MYRQDRAIDGVWRDLKSGSRFVVECGEKDSIDGILNGVKKPFIRRGLKPEVVLSPWHFADVQAMQQRLGACGFIARKIARFWRSTLLPEKGEGLLFVFVHDFLASFDAEKRKYFFTRRWLSLRLYLQGGISLTELLLVCR